MGAFNISIQRIVTTFRAVWNPDFLAQSSPIIFVVFTSFFCSKHFCC